MDGSAASSSLAEPKLAIAFHLPSLGFINSLQLGFLSLAGVSSQRNFHPQKTPLLGAKKALEVVDFEGFHSNRN
jgi:hypothetical protein